MSFFENLSKIKISLICSILVAGLCLGDIAVGPEISTSIFYIIPIYLEAWYGGRRMAYVISFLSAVAWGYADVTSGSQYSHAWILFWNSGVRLLIFLLIAHFVGGFRQKLKDEEAAADTDVLTGAMNRRAFFERIADEFERARRFHHPVTLAYIDLDNFKTVNDTFGHAKGDQLLQLIVEVIRRNCRKLDLLARIGGDEFTLFFPEADAVAAIGAMEKIRQALLSAMGEHGYPVTFSIGMITSTRAAIDISQIVYMADRLMYEVKKSGKNSIQHLTLDDDGKGHGKLG
ncbi:MAG: diguanylate cyclase [Proteobacteria bacterium]|nr:diguanylate cyclase [Pseudomonadota bacterium]MBU1687735.1 diguanylate cyclase [Pseudomonadota bacterium]